MAVNRTSASRGQRARWMVATCCAAAAPCVSAQGIYPGDLSKEGYKLPGGFEPVLHLRTYYFGQESVTGTESEAWAAGGWAGLRSPWWGDLFQVGLVGYTSLKLYGPDDKDGTRLLEPGQDSFAVLGEAFAAVRLFDQTLTGYRQLINRPYINPQDSRMVPNTFEAYTLTGSAADVSYTGGYITKIKIRNADSFSRCRVPRAARGDHKGVAYAGATWAFAKDAYVRLDEQYGVDVFNTFYVDGQVSDRDRRTRRRWHWAPSTPRRSRSATHRSGRSRPGVWACRPRLRTGRSAAQLYYTQTGKGFDTQNPFGDHASYLNLMQVAFNTAGEKAWGIGGNINFAGLGVPGLTAAAVYASGSDRINAATGAAIADRNETDVRVDYAFAKGTALEGLVATLRSSWLHQSGSPQTAPQLRAYLNYAVRF